MLNKKQKRIKRNKLQRLYRMTRNGKEVLKRYRKSDKAKKCQKKYTSSKKAKITRSVYFKKYRTELKARIVSLYTNGTNRCIFCGGKVEELHHKEPSAGKFEKDRFGSNACLDARKLQLKMYKLDPTYIQPCCKDCHRDEHVALKQQKEKIKKGVIKCIEL